MEWLNLRSQLQSAIPAQGHVPMVEQARRANRFVSLLVGSTEPEPLPKLSKEQRLWQLVRLQVRVVEARRQEVEDKVFHQWTYSDQPDGQTNPQPQV